MKTTYHPVKLYKIITWHQKLWAAKSREAPWSLSHFALEKQLTLSIWSKDKTLQLLVSTKLMRLWDKNSTSAKYFSWNSTHTRGFHLKWTHETGLWQLLKSSTRNRTLTEHNAQSYIKGIQMSLKVAGAKNSSGGGEFGVCYGGN